MPSRPASILTHGPTAAGPESAARLPSPPSSSSAYPPLQRPAPGPASAASSARPYDEGQAPYSSGYSSFPSTAQSPPTTASTMRPSISGLPPSSSSYAAPFPRQPFPFSHDDTDRSRLAYDTLSASAKAYRVALGQLSAAASNFGAALEACARLKEARAQPYPPGPYASGRHGMLNNGGGGGAGGGAGGTGGLMSSGSSLHEASCTADVLLATSGLYYLMANQQGILAETVYRSFELPIVHELDRYGADVEAEQESYAAGMREASREIRRLEKEGVKLRKPRQRDVGRMRSHLVAMTEALDALTARQGEHAVALLDQSRDMSSTVSQASRNLVRAEVDILDSLARKGWPGGGLDVVLDGAVDLFSRDGDDGDDNGLGGTPNGAGIGSSSHAVVSGAGGILGSGVGDLSLGPKLLLLGGGGGGGGGPVSSGLSQSESDDDDDGQTGDDGADADDDDDGNDDASEVSTINGNAKSNRETEAGSSTGGGGGGFFSILTGGSILGRRSDALKPGQDAGASDRRGRSPRKGKRPSSGTLQQQQSTAGGEQDEDDDEGDDEAGASQQAGKPKQKARQQRYARADSLSVESGYQHQYQSLDSLAHAEAAAGSDTASTHTRGASASRQTTSAKLPPPPAGRSRPFSPQRVAVDPQEDLFTGQFSSPERTMSLAWLKEGEQLETPQEEEGEAKDDAESGGGSQASEGKGKGAEAAPAAVPASPTSESASASASRASSATPTPGLRQHDTDEGVHIWRQEG